MAIEKISSTSAVYQAAGNTQQVAKAVESVVPVVNAQAQNVAAPNQTKSGSFKEDGESKREASNENIKKAVSDLNKKMSNTTCQFGIHEATNRVTIKIIDKETKNVIKEYPAEETLEMIEKAWELAGIMFDKKL